MRGGGKPLDPRLLAERRGRAVVNRGGDQLARKPPSTQRLWPTTNDAASEASHATASATSSGSPMRRSGRPAATAPMSAIFEPSIIGVSTRPGEIALMRILCGAYSIAAARVSASTAAFEAA